VTAARASLALLVTLLGCSSKPDRIAPAAADRAIDERVAQEPAAGQSAPGCQIDAEIAAAVRLRGLPVLAPIRCQILPRQALVDQAMETSLRDMPQAWIDAQTQGLILLGFTDETFDLVRASKSMLTEQLAGFYDPQRDVLFVAEDMVDRTVLIHEIVHALQDQHFDLGKRMGAAKTSDALTALQILAEGDAMSAMLEIPRDGTRAGTMAAETMGTVGAFLAEATPTEVPVPAILKRSMIAPYLDGFSLVERLRIRGDWSNVNALWVKQPVTSAALLSDDPIGAAHKPGVAILQESPPWRPALTPLYDDVSGEQSLRVMFEEWLSRTNAAEAAHGWLGDRFTVYQQAGSSGLYWRLRWASSRDTLEALQAFAKGYFSEQATSIAASAKVTQVWSRNCEGSSGHPLVLATRGDEIVLVAQSRKAALGPAGCQQLTQWARSALQ
jgi:hypothetical protein